MTFSLHDLALGTFAPMLESVGALLRKGAAHAGDAASLVGAKLAPDMYPLATQVQLACHHAQDAMLRLAGRTPAPLEVGGAPSSIDGLEALIAATVATVRGVDEASFAGAAERDLEMPLQGPLVLRMKGARFLRDWALPHFYFHVVTAYDILRSQGVVIGKRDYLSYVGDAVHTS